MRCSCLDRGYIVTTLDQGDVITVGYYLSKVLQISVQPLRVLY